MRSDIVVLVTPEFEENTSSGTKVIAYFSLKHN